MRKSQVAILRILKLSMARDEDNEEYAVFSNHKLTCILKCYYGRNFLVFLARTKAIHISNKEIEGSLQN